MTEFYVVSMTDVTGLDNRILLCRPKTCHRCPDRNQMEQVESELN